MSKKSKATAQDILNFVRSTKGDNDDYAQILGAGEAFNPDDVVRTGSITFDYATGRGGIKKGSLVQIYGPEASGKTTTALSIIANIHKNDPNAAVPYFDAENSLSPEWMTTIGVNLDSTPIIYPDHQEDFINVTRSLLKSVSDKSIDEIPMVVLDSVASLHSKEVIESSADDETSRAKEPRVWAKHLPSVSKELKKSGAIGIFINQARDNQSMYGPQHTYPGGRTLKHAMNLNIMCQQISKLSEVDAGTKEKILHGMECKIEKNKTSGNLGKFIIRWRVGEPISRGWGLVDVIELMKRRDDSKSRRLDFDPENFQSAIDNVPYVQGKKWDAKSDEPVSSANAWSIMFWEDILDAIQEDDPEFDDKGLSGKSFASKKAFISFIDSHPTLADVIEEYVLETLNLNTGVEELDTESPIESDEEEEFDEDEALDDDELEDEEDEEYDEDEEEEDDEE